MLQNWHIVFFLAKCFVSSFGHNFNLVENKKNTPILIYHAVRVVFDFSGKEKKEGTTSRLTGVHNCIYCIKTRRQLE